MMDTQRLIIQMAQGVDHSGQDPQRAAVRAAKRALNQASIVAPEALGLDAEDVLVRITLGVPAGAVVETAPIVDLNKMGKTLVALVEGGLRVRDPETGAEQIVVTAAAEVFLPRQSGFALT